MNLHEALRIDLEAMNETLIDVVRLDPDLKNSPVIAESVTRLIRSGGKRLRPMMVLIGSRFGSAPSYGRSMRVAAILEYLHMASLVHDDIIDRSDLRRNELTLHHVLGVREAIHLANYMMARAVEWLLAEDPEEMDKGAKVSRGKDNKTRLRMAASLVTQLCIGEYQQLDNRFQYDLSLADYLEKTRNKTALLMASCFQAGADITHANKETSRLLYSFGEYLGMAFQIRDDVLDYRETAAAIGKPPGSDLRNGNVTLPVLYALEIPGLNTAIRALDAHSSDEAFNQVVERITDSGAIERTLEVSRKYTDKARLIINKLSNYPAHSDLQILLDHFTK
ncbi:MAG: polyprenyl synthetase family protein [Gorillibacterium sp.]|nr:polyprenyl synthetase family protein [Gorillibacterium sp.]